MKIRKRIPLSCLTDWTTSGPRWNILFTRVHGHALCSFFSRPAGLKPRPRFIRKGFENQFFLNSSPASGNADGKQTSSHQHMHAAHTYPSILLWPWAHYTDIAEPQRATLTLTFTFCFIPRLNLRKDYAIRPQKCIRIYFFLASTVCLCDLWYNTYVYVVVISMYPVF